MPTNPRGLRLDGGLFSHALLDSHPSTSFFFLLKIIDIYCFRTNGVKCFTRMTLYQILRGKKLSLKPSMSSSQQLSPMAMLPGRTHAAGENKGQWAAYLIKRWLK